MNHSIKKQIIAIGGGGFTLLSKQASPVCLEQYFLDQTSKTTPKICFIPTASGENKDYIINFYQAFSQLNCKPTHLSFFKLPTADLKSYLLEQDAIFVGGGNTKSMLALWKEWNVDRYLRTAWERGIVLGGVSAGSICWFEQGVTDSIPGPLTALDCLGFLKGSNCPHYDGEAERKPAYKQLLLDGKISNGLAIDDKVAVHFINDSIAHILKINPQASAYLVSKNDTTVEEKNIAL